MKRFPVTLTSGMQHFLRREQGLSLIEVIIALAIGVVLLMGLSTVFLTNRKTYAQVQAQSRIQENARFAMDYMDRSLRQIGYSGCASSKMVVSHSDLSAASYKNYVIDPVFGQSAVHLHDSTSATAWTPALPADLVGKVKAGTDVVGGIIAGDTNTFQVKAQSVASCIASADNATCSMCDGMPLEVVNPSVTFKVGDVVMASSCSGNTIFKVSAVGSSGGNVTLAHATGGGNNSICLSGDYNQQGGTVSLFGDNGQRTVMYYIGDTGRTDSNGDKVYGLFEYSYTIVSGSTFTEVAEGVEDMQVYYGIDTRADGDLIPSKFVSGKNVSFGTQSQVSPGVTGIAGDDNIVSVQIGLTLNGVDPLPNDNATTRTQMKYSFTQTVQLRNSGRTVYFSQL